MNQKSSLREAEEQTLQNSTRTAIREIPILQIVISPIGARNVDDIVTSTKTNGQGESINP